MIFRAQPVSDPGAHAGSTLVCEPGMQKVVGVLMNRGRCGHGTDHADIVDALGDVGKQLADRDATFTVFIKCPWRTKSITDFVKLGWFDVDSKRSTILFG